jgi:hypothetical protein
MPESHRSSVYTLLQVFQGITGLNYIAIMQCQGITGLDYKQAFQGITVIIYTESIVLDSKIARVQLNTGLYTLTMHIKTLYLFQNIL